MNRLRHSTEETAYQMMLDRKISELNDKIELVQMQVGQVNRLVETVKLELSKVASELDEYIQFDLKSKQLQWAETRIVGIRQTLETKFGHYEDIRKKTIGIFQAAEAGVVREEVMRTATEKVMISAPQYWLASCLVAVSAWISDNQDLASKALREALRRNEEKTSLFFALVHRRIGREKVSEAWLEHYFSLLNPRDLSQDLVVLMDAFSIGVFGVGGKEKIAKQVKEWLDRLGEDSEIDRVQIEEWKKVLERKSGDQDSEGYQLLPVYSPTWGTLQTVMNHTKKHQVIYEYFKQVFESEYELSARIELAVDKILYGLIKRYDAEELPLRKEERQLSLIIEEQGDTKKANDRLEDENQVFEDRLNFKQILKNVSLHPELTDTSKSLQRFAIALSKDWIIQAHNNFTAKTRAQVPYEIELELGNWKGKTTDGSNEDELMRSIDAHYDQELQRVMGQVKLSIRQWVVSILLTLVTLPFLSLWSLLIGGIIPAYFYITKWIPAKEANQVEIDEKKRKSKEILRGLLAEVVDWRRKFQKEDANAKLVTEYLGAIKPDEFVGSKYDKSRLVLNQ